MRVLDLNRLIEPPGGHWAPATAHNIGTSIGVM
jgi:hypothetical protein